MLRCSGKLSMTFFYNVLDKMPTNPLFDSLLLFPVLLELLRPPTPADW